MVPRSLEASHSQLPELQRSKCRAAPLIKAAPPSPFQPPSQSRSGDDILICRSRRLHRPFAGARHTLDSFPHYAVHYKGPRGRVCDPLATMSQEPESGSKRAAEFNEAMLGVPGYADDSMFFLVRYGERAKVRSQTLAAVTTLRPPNG